MEKGEIRVISSFLDVNIEEDGPESILSMAIIVCTPVIVICQLQGICLYFDFAGTRKEADA